MTDRREYNPQTCLTARELREVWGLSIPESIPDAAWVSRTDMNVSLEDVHDGEAGDKNLVLNFRVEFHRPFEWIEASFVIGPGANHDEG